MSLPPDSHASIVTPPAAQFLAWSSGARLGHLGKWRWIVVLVLVSTLVWFAGPQQVWRTVRGAEPTWALAATTILVPWFLLGVLNVWVLLRRLAPIPFRTFATVYVQSWTSGLLLPGQLGDATQVWLLRRHGVPMSFSSAAYATDKAVSLGFMLVVAASGTALYGFGTRYGFGGTRWGPVVFVMGSVIVAAGVGILVLSGVVDRLPSSRVGRALGHVKSALTVFAREHRLLSLNLGITVLKWMLMVTAYACAFRAFGPPVSLAAVATIPAMSSLVGHIPVSIGGLGTTEWTAVGLFGRLGVPEAIVLSVYVLLRASGALIAIVLLAARGRAHR
jgi:uncharacterized membrane protein YbhN (UPF0104 family)